MAADYPAVHEQAIRRLRDTVGVEPVELPTTRRHSTAKERAEDLNAAFADPSIRAILATIGGGDQITVLSYLNPALARSGPKPFIGHSDNTNLLNWLWFHGLSSAHGGSTQVHLGPGPAIDQGHLTSLQAALFDGQFTLEAPPRSRDTGLDWDDPRSLTDFGPDAPSEPWTWAGPATCVEGPTWGGNREVLTWTMVANRWVMPNEAYAGCVLLLETSEDRPSPREVYRMLRNMGERGLLAMFPALIWGRPPAGDNAQPVPPRTPSPYERPTGPPSCGSERVPPTMVVAMDVDFGHTIPQ